MPAIANQTYPLLQSPQNNASNNSGPIPKNSKIVQDWVRRPEVHLDSSPLRTVPEGNDRKAINYQKRASIWTKRPAYARVQEPMNTSKVVGNMISLTKSLLARFLLFITLILGGFCIVEGTPLLALERSNLLVRLDTAFPEVTASQTM